MHSSKRCYALFLLTLTLAGPYFIYDNPSELETRIESEFKITQTKYSQLYSVYSLPNIVLPMFSGVLLTKIGYGNGLLLTSFIILIGQIIQAMGGYRTSFNLLLLGRLF